MTETPRLTAALSDRYAIEREIGSGGMATVYLARDLKHDREVALKVLRADLSAVLGAGRFLKEISITAKLDHPHILTLIDSGEADGILYYVLPLVRGESLRARLEREKQLPIEEALNITRQVASALDYAHKQGVVHRDIKPENILLHEGEAVVADFGIALALREAGGSRLTETGLSLGTPQYMSPEQATGDRTLDARSDIYSLGAVLYEMLAGEPPVTGPTVQAVIAKLLTERPTRLRTVRDTIPDPIDAAVAKALAKVPADRFASAAEFAAALKTPGSAAALPAPRRRLSAPAWLAIAGVVVLAVLGAWMAKTRAGGAGGPPISLSGKTQLTFTGNVQGPALSADGKQLAFIVRNCAEGRCTYAIEVQDVGAPTTHRIFDGATAAYQVAWSPDRRNLLATATIGGRWGVYLLSALGGTPRYLTSGAAAFYAGGDSLLIGPPFRPDSVFWVRVATLDGAVADSIRVAGRGLGLAALVVVPSSRWFAAMIPQEAGALWQVLDRRGRVADRVVNSCNCGGNASTDALWLARQGNAGDHSVIRFALDAANGHLARHQDTVLTGTITSFSVTSDGSTLAYDEGTYDYGAWAMALAEALKGRFPESRRLLRASSPVNVAVSPDGARLLVSRVLPSASGALERHLSTLPFGGGREIPLQTSGSVLTAFWRDSVSVLVATGSRGQHVAILDVRTGAVERSTELQDTTIVDLTPLPDGWAWIPGSDDRIVIHRAGKTTEVRKPAWFGVLFQVNADPSGRYIGMTGWNASTFDTIGVAVVSSDGGVPAMWATHFAEGGGMNYLSDGSIALKVLPSEEAVTIYRLAAPGQAQLVGTVPRPVSGISYTADLRRVAIDTRDYHGDAWMSRVVKR